MKEWLVKQWLDGNRSAVCAPQQAFSLQLLEIPPNRCNGNAQQKAKLLHGDGPRLAKLAQYPIRPQNGFRNHFKHRKRYRRTKQSQTLKTIAYLVAIRAT